MRVAGQNLDSALTERVFIKEEACGVCEWNSYIGNRDSGPQNLQRAMQSMSQKRDIAAFKKFAQRRCQTLLNKANELFLGLVEQGHDAHVSVFVHDDGRTILYTSDREYWPFRFLVRIHQQSLQIVYRH